MTDSFIRRFARSFKAGFTGTRYATDLHEKQRIGAFEYSVVAFTRGADEADGSTHWLVEVDIENVSNRPAVVPLVGTSFQEGPRRHRGSELSQEGAYLNPGLRRRATAEAQTPTEASLDSIALHVRTHPEREAFTVVFPMRGRE